MQTFQRSSGRSSLRRRAAAASSWSFPPYHKAHWKHIIKEAFVKAYGIFKRALGTVTLVSLFFWALSFSSTGDIAGSLLYRIGTAIEPVTRIFGLGWRTFMAFLTAGFAKEAVLGVLMTQTISKAEALAFIFASTFSVPCVMALSTTYRESHSLKWTARIAGFYIGCALILAGIVYHLASLFL